MRATIFRDDLLAAVNLIKPAVPSYTAIPIFAHVLIEAENGALRLRGSDCHFEIATTVACDVRKEGATTVLAATLARLLKALPEKSAVQMEVNEKDDLVIKAGRCQATLRTLPPLDFAPMLVAEDVRTFALPGHVLHRLLSGTAFAAGTGPIRPHLAGVYLHLAQAASGRVLRAVATSGHFLALADADLPAGADDIAGVILPSKAVRTLIEALKPDDKKAEAAEHDIALVISPRLVVVTIGMTTYSFRPIDGAFPDYLRVIPQAPGNLLKVDRAAFIGALGRVATASVGGRAVKIDMAHGRVHLASRSLVKVDKAANYEFEICGEEEVDAEYDGAPLIVGANGSYLMSIVEHAGEAAVAARFADPGSAILLDGSNSLFVLMPMRV